MYLNKFNLKKYHQHDLSEAGSLKCQQFYFILSIKQYNLKERELYCYSCTICHFILSLNNLNQFN